MNRWHCTLVGCASLSLLVMRLCLGATARAAEPAPATAADSRISLVVLSGTPADRPGESDLALGELAKAMEATPGLTILDRDHIRKILSEHQLSSAGVVRQPIKQGRMLGAKYLLSTETLGNASAQTLAILCIEVSSGNVIWERAFALDAIKDPKTVGPWATQQAREAVAAMATSQQRRDRPTATVLSVANRSQSNRLDFMESSLQGLLEDLLESRGYRVLRRRNPGLLSKETALGASGMVRPDAAVLAEAADLVITASFAESPSGDVAFEQTPIKLTLGLRRRAEANRDTPITFSLAELKKLTGELRSTLPPATPAATATSAPADDLLSQRIEAARLQADLKDLGYGSSLEDLRHQIELAQRVIYLDPSAKEAYYHLGISLDALTRKTWHIGGAHEGSSQSTADALSTYLSFPRTNLDHVHDAFRYLACHVDVLNRNSPEKNLSLLTEWFRWSHEQDPVNLPDIYVWPQYYFDGWWYKHPQERVAFYTWLDQLYKEKKHLSVVPLKLAWAHDQLNQYDKAAEFLYDGIVAHGLSQIELNSLTGGEVGEWWLTTRPRELAKRLDAKRSAELLGRLRGGSPEPAAPLQALYGKTYGQCKDLYEYSYRADNERIEKAQYAKAEPEAVSLGQTLLQSVVVRKTPSGLWMQGGTDDGSFALFFSSDGTAWRQINTPEPMTTIRPLEHEARSANYVVSINEIGGETLFATFNAGLFVYDRKKDSWRQFFSKEGLPAKFIIRMAESADHQSAWLAGGGFLSRYQDGKLFLSKTKIDLFPDALLASADRFITIDDEVVVSAGREGGGKRELLTRTQQRALLPVSPLFRGPPRSYNAGVVTWRRLAQLGDTVYFAGEHGLTVLTTEGKVIGHWYPDTFCHWNELGGWLKGNCPLPPCVLLEVLADDQNPNLLWLVSKYYDVIPPYDFGYAAFPKKMWRSMLNDKYDTVSFITAFDTKTNRFSQPVPTKAPFTHAQPFGDYVYLTGKTFARLPKKLWVVDQPGIKDDQPPKIVCPDTILGHASQALMLGNQKEAAAHLQTALDAAIAPAAVGKMLKELPPQPQSPPSTTTAPTR